MDEAAYQQWWRLHLRVARGEALSHEDAATYERGAQAFDQDERLDGDLADLRRARSAVLESEAKQQALHARQAALAAEIAAQEAYIARLRGRIST